MTAREGERVTENEPNPADMTSLLKRAGRGDSQASEQLARAADAELRKVAEAYLRKERIGHVLDAGALVNEAWISLLPLLQGKSDWASRKSFYAAAAKTMRHVLVDAARARDALKRGGDKQRLPFEMVAEGIFAEPVGLDTLIDLDDALVKFGAVDARAARVVELRVFSGLTVREIADVLGCAASTVDGDLAAAREWLAARLGRPGA